LYNNIGRQVVSPNPANEYINIETGSEQKDDASHGELNVHAVASDNMIQPYHLTVYNSQQIPVFTTESKDHKVTISTRELPNGIYIAEITHSGKRIFKRFAVNH
jgi:hypothetical protein